jgi:uncharacterized repeat protein (TIGR01451 family)
VSTPPAVHKLDGNKLPALTIVKTSASVPFSKLGDILTYSFKVTNSGNVTLTTSITVADDKIATVSCPSIGAGLAPKAFITCTGTYAVTQVDLDAGTVVNTATASAGPGVTSPTVSLPMGGTKLPALTISKTSAVTSFSVVGTVIPYTYVVTNSGNVTLTAAITVSDNKIRTVNCPILPIGGLAPTKSITCFGNYTVVQADIDGGAVVNVASALSGGVASPSVTYSIDAQKLPSLSVVKTSSVTTYTKVGDVLPYSYVVTNTGNVTLTSAVTVSDSKIASVTCPALPAGGLAPSPLANSTITCSGRYTVLQADLDAGSITNTASAKSDTTTSPTVTLTIGGTKSPALTVLKTSTVAGITTLGQVVPYSYKVTNTGNVTLTTAITVSDNKIPVVTCPAIPALGLAPGAFLTCTANYTVTQADLDAGSVSNTASATTGGVTSPPVTLKIDVIPTRALTLVKSSATTKFLAVGEVITYSFRATNTGNVTLTTPISISDPMLGASGVTCPTPNPPAGGLAPGAFITCTGPYTVTQADLDTGSITNVATATTDQVVSPPSTLKINGEQKPDFSVQKTAVSAMAKNNGDGSFTTQFTMKVLNTGNVTLSAMQVEDDYQSSLPLGAKVTSASVQSVTSSLRASTGTHNPAYDATAAKPALLTTAGETLSPGEAMIVAFTISFDPGANPSGTAFVNNAVASAKMPGGSGAGARVSKASAASVPFEANHPLIVTKTTPKSDVTRGDLVPYSITIRNDFDPALHDLTLIDLMPPGFKYREASATINGVRKDPTIAGRQLSWTGYTVEKGKPIKINLILIAGAGVGDGEFTNEAFVRSLFGGVISNVGKATVRVIPDPTFDCTDIIGKVFDDANRNGYPDDGERGIANVRIATVKGQLITTDAEGRFHIACADIPDDVRGSNYVLKLDERTLPTGYRLTTENPHSVRITRGKMAKMNFGAALHRVARLDISDQAFEPGTTRLHAKWFDALPAIFDQLRKEKSVLRLGYKRSPTEDQKLAQTRLLAVRQYFIETWRAEGSGYELSVETEVYVSKSAQN